jgi:hypothetical protein
MSALTKVDLEHVDAPVLRTYSHREFGALLSGFRDVRLVTERFPVRSRLHRGWKAALFNGVFVRAFNALPRRVTGSLRLAPDRVLHQVRAAVLSLIKAHAYGNDFPLRP